MGNCCSGQTLSENFNILRPGKNPKDGASYFSDIDGKKIKITKSLISRKF